MRKMMHFIPMEILLSAAALITEGAYIQISGGVLRVNASGDGIDSNGDLTVSGGKTYLSGPVNSGNGILDYNGSAVVTGGIFAASGSSGMAQNFDSSSTIVSNRL